ncbi:MAG: hypothetical protein AB7K73_12985 [Gammaproteobacteria bacterium]
MSARPVTLEAQEFAVLNVIHLKRLAGNDALVALTGLDAATLGPLIGAAATRGLVMSTEAGHMLLPEGTDAVRAYYDDTYAALRGDAVIEAWYRRFETLNTRFIALLTSWQGHPADDALFKALAVIEQLSQEIERLVPRIPRYQGYQQRFDAAIGAIDGGDTGLLCDPRRDSAHNIWFEFHEDILGVLGRPRDTT